MQLSTWLVRNKMKPAHFARKIGVSRASVSFWLRGLEIPNGWNALKIEQVTGGAVPARDWQKRRSIPEPVR